MDQESLWEKFLDGIYGALCLLQMVDEGNRLITLGGQNSMIVAQLCDCRSDGNASPDDQ